MERIIICLCLHDKAGNYSKYMGVVMESVLRNTDREITFFIFHDDTLTEKIKEKFDKTVSRYGAKIEYVQPEIPENWKRLHKVTAFTIGTLFRLFMVDMLPEEIDRAIYLDADTLVNIDIAELWEQDFKENLVLGKKDLFWDNPLFREGVSQEEYINAGVLLFNIKGLREQGNFLEETNSFFETHLDCAFLDQDAINFVLRGKIGFLEDRFNKFVLYERGKDDIQENCIFHFVSDQPRTNGEEFFDRLFWRILSDSFWSEELLVTLYQSSKSYENRINAYKNVHSRVGQGNEIILWGAVAKKAYQRIKSVLHTDNYCFVDRDPKLIGTCIDGHVVNDISVLSNAAMVGQAYIIVMAFNHYREIAEELKTLGYREFIDFCNVKALLD